ncbi:MAG: hypothetical protein HY698_00115 [Deltaproteobacteria bacterium]|nr:hypothetical protein [Deltaproteobacteria bacterium]
MTALLIAGILAALAAAGHGVGGELTNMRKVRFSGTIPDGERLEIRATWHLFTLHLVFSAVVLLGVGFRILPRQAHAIVPFLGAYFVACGAVFLLVLLARGPRWIIRHPQWVLLVTIGGLALLGET